MKRVDLDGRVSVSGQISLDDFEELVAEGVEVVVCNRPDNEESGQLNFSEIEQLAKRHGVTAVHIPFAPGEMQPQHVEAFKPYLDSGQKVHAYCRSGRRSKTLWESASSH